MDTDHISVAAALAKTTTTVHGNSPPLLLRNGLIVRHLFDGSSLGPSLIHLSPFLLLRTRDYDVCNPVPSLRLDGHRNNLRLTVHLVDEHGRNSHRAIPYLLCH